MRYIASGRFVDGEQGSRIESIPLRIFDDPSVEAHFLTMYGGAEGFFNDEWSRIMIVVIRKTDANQSDGDFLKTVGIGEYVLCRELTGYRDEFFISGDSVFARRQIRWNGEGPSAYRRLK